MSSAASLQNTATKPQQSTLLAHGESLLQRKCACGALTSSLTDECEECKSKKRLQTKLTIGTSTDPLEQEADRVADQVLAAPKNTATTKAPLKIQRFAGQATGQTGTAPSSVDRVLTSPGRPLESSLRQDMEQRFGHDLSQVRVHTGPAAEQSAREVNARAYTVGHSIVFGGGQYTPQTREGLRLIAHELTHVLQQSQSNVGDARQSSGGHIFLQRFLSTEPAGGCGLCYGIPANAGKAAHKLIQTEFEILYPLGLVELNVTDPTDESGSLDLAVAVPGGFEIGEIKPANEKGYADGITQIAKYIGLISQRYPSAAIKPLTKLLPPAIFPTLSPQCPVQAIFVNPPVGGVYGYFCKPSFAELKGRGCGCPVPRKIQEEEKQEEKEKERKKDDKKTLEKQTVPEIVPSPEVKSIGQRILEFVRKIIEEGLEVDSAVSNFLKENKEILDKLELAVAAIVAGAIISDIASGGAAIAKDPLVASILAAMIRIGQALRAVAPAL
jgi:hypothetical protein